MIFPCLHHVLYFSCLLILRGNIYSSSNHLFIPHIIFLCMMVLNSLINMISGNGKNTHHLVQIWLHFSYKNGCWTCYLMACYLMAFIGWFHQCVMDINLGNLLGDGERKGGLACCSLWGRKESEMTWRLNNNVI